MKKCPYCAESIQDEAVICRFCNRRVKKNKWKQILILAVLCGMLLSCMINAVKVRSAVFSMKYKAENLSRDLRNAIEILKGLLEDLKNGIIAIKELGDQSRNIRE